jgi:hypothetical protein
MHSNPEPSLPLRLCASARETLHSQPANRELITRFEQKIQTTLARVWGEEPAEEGLAQRRKVLRIKKSNAFKSRTFSSFASLQLCARNSSFPTRQPRTDHPLRAKNPNHPRPRVG